jgi:hypothetical protein
MATSCINGFETKTYRHEKVEGKKKKKAYLHYVGSQSTQSKTLPIRLLPFKEVRLFLYEKSKDSFFFSKTVKIQCAK